MKAKLFTLGVLCMVPFVLVVGGRGYRSYAFSRDCGGWLKLAADASSISTADERLGKALAHLESEGLVEGNTSLIFTTPENDVGAWYGNLKGAKRNLETFPALATEADINTALSKLRETVLDHGSNGDYVTRPDYIELYPHVWLWLALFVTSLVFALVGTVLVSLSFD